MINLFESFDLKTKELYYSQVLAESNIKTIVIENDGFLPEDIDNPYDYFINSMSKEERPIFFNEVKVPEYWQIEGNNNNAEIKDNGNVRGRIVYKRDYGYRIVDRVEWLDKEDTTHLIDYYNKYGNKYAQLVLDDTQKRIMKVWFYPDGKEVIIENFITNDIILYCEGKQFFFKSKVEFIIFYLNEIKVPLDSFLINSLSIPYGIIYSLNQKGNDIMFWQEKIEKSIPGNMKLMLGNNIRKTRFLTENENEFKCLKHMLGNEVDIKKSGYIYSFQKNNNYNKEILIVTNSDQIPHLKEIALDLYDYTFHVAAITEMSKILLDIGQVENIKLHPNVDKERIMELYKLCDVYLDINMGSEVLDAVKAEFEYNMLIFTYTNIVHNEKYICNENIYLQENYMDMIHEIRRISDNKKLFDTKLRNQRKKAGSIKKDLFNKVLKLP